MENLPNTKITKKYKHGTTTTILCGMPASATQMTEKERKKQIQCKYGIANYNPLECQQAPPRWQRGSKGRECHTKPENGHRCMFVNARTNKNKYNHSSTYRITTGNARLRNVGKCHPGDKKEGVPHLLENWRLRQLVMVPSIQTACCLP